MVTADEERGGGDSKPDFKATLYREDGRCYIDVLNTGNKEVIKVGRDIIAETPEDAALLVNYCVARFNLQTIELSPEISMRGDGPDTREIMFTRNEATKEIQNQPNASLSIPDIFRRIQKRVQKR